MAERICALLGSGNSPRVPTGRGARLDVRGGVGEFLVDADDCNSLSFNGDGLYDLPDCNYIRVGHAGPPTSSFFVLRG